MLIALLATQSAALCAIGAAGILTLRRGRRHGGLTFSHLGRLGLSWCWRRSATV